MDGDYELIKALAETVSYLSTLSAEKSASIKRLLKILFGDKTEKSDRTEANQSPKKPKKKEKPKGHGKNGVSAYKGARKIMVSHQTFKSGNDCPACHKGKVYGEKPPARIVRITGGAPFKATVYELQLLRCNLCGEVFTAKAPDNIGDEKYDTKSGTMLALLKYGSGVPMYRIGKLKASLGIPLPPIHQAAQGHVLYNDDTTMKILSLMKETEKETKRKGLLTSGILSECNAGKVHYSLRACPMPVKIWPGSCRTDHPKRTRPSRIIQKRQKVQHSLL
jgi:transposase